MNAQEGGGAPDIDGTIVAEIDLKLFYFFYILVLEMVEICRNILLNDL